MGSNDGRFYVLNLTDGAKLWEFDRRSTICFTRHRERPHHHWLRRMGASIASDEE